MLFKEYIFYSLNSNSDFISNNRSTNLDERVLCLLSELLPIKGDINWIKIQTIIDMLTITYFENLKHKPIKKNTNLVRVYWNLNKKCWSVCSKENGNKLLYHTDKFYLSNCFFVVSQKGRERVLREKRKNVHAYVEGFFDNNLPVPRKSSKTKQITYNPYIASFFFDKKTFEKKEMAKHCWFEKNGEVYYK